MNVSSALDLDEVVDADGEAGDLIGVVQGGAGDGGATDEDGCEHGDGSYLSGGPTWKSTRSSCVMAGAGGELVCDGPARGHGR